MIKKGLLIMLCLSMAVGMFAACGAPDEGDLPHLRQKAQQHRCTLRLQPNRQ